MTLWVESRRAGHGEVAAFELLWERHAAATREAILRVLGTHRSLADDVLQEAWLEVTHARAYRPGSFRAFIRTVATRKALDRMATSAVRRSESEDAAGALPASGSGPAREAQAREGAGLVLGIAGRLPHLQRVAWVLRYVEEMTFEEIADAMGTPVGTAKTRVRLANEFVADALDGAGIARVDVAEEG
jgi:RNA polymerase sigma-70 factor (ECF subfamily)